MFHSVSVPFWILAILAVLASIAFLDRIFAPSVRWFFRRRLNTAIDELNTHLDTQIQPFKLTRKQTLVDQLMYDPHIIRAAEEEAENEGTPLPVVMKKAERYAREIVPSFSPLAYFGIGTRISKWLSRSIYRVRLGFIDDDKLREIDPNSSVIFVMNHRSNMDYILVTYLASTRTTLSYAVGEWARVFGLQTLIRAMGAYFIRRSSGNELYRRVLARYVAMATREGVTQAVFPEGGLSRDGKLNPPKLGLLSYMLSDFNPTAGKDIVFIPVGINYDRTLEDRILTARKEAEYSGRDFKFKTTATLGFIWTLIRRRFSGQLYKMGYACVSFGNPISMKDWLKGNNVRYDRQSEKRRFETIQSLGDDLMKHVGNVIPALPVALVATIFAERDFSEPMSELELKGAVSDLISELADEGHHVHIPRKDLDYSISAGLRMLLLRHAVTSEKGEFYLPNKQEKILLEYYANSIAHLRMKT
ncbi:MAG: 1-acyl-sn-glycerol-3-phosphate acyltransferase [Pseudomonadota bacterium]